jgi:hypothetical protein
MSWETLAAKAGLSGSFASVLSAIVLALCGRIELRDPWAPLNGPSQWLFGTRAARKSGFSARHTVSGYLIHHAASVFWALVFERLRARRGRAIASPAAATAALACFVDFRLTPRRLTPGFERRLSRKSLAVVYVAFAIGLAAGAALRAKAR